MNYAFPKISMFSVTVTFLLLSFLVSNFYFNSGTNTITSYFKILSYFILFYVFLKCFAEYLFLNENSFEIFLNIILVFTIVNSILSIFFNIIGLNQNPIYPNHTLGLFTHPNTISNVFTLSIPVLFYKYFSGKINAVIFYILLLLFSYCLLFTFSRAGYLGTLIAILLITFFKSKKAFIFTLVIIAAISFYFVFDVASSKTNSSFARILLIATAIDMITTNLTTFLGGYGVYNAIEVFKNEKVFFGNYESVVDPHNTILLLGIQFGMIVSLISILIVLAISVKVSIKAKYLDLKDKLKANLLVTVIISILFHNMLEDILVYPEYFVMPVFLTFFGILLIYNKMLNSRSKVE